MENCRRTALLTGRASGEKRDYRSPGTAARYALVSTLILFFSLLPLSAQEITIKSSVDWLDSVILFDLEAPLPEGSMKPSHRFQTEQYIESKAPYMITEELGNITVDSLNKMSDLLYSDPLFYTSVEEQIGKMNKTFSRSTADMRHFTLRYTMPFFPFLIELFPLQEEAKELNFFTPLDYRREEFTGIIIYAQGLYPLQGTDREVEPQPALFPKLLNENLDVVYERSMVNPDSLRRWGMVRYSREATMDPARWREQIGTKPLQISARGLYGKYPTNIILSEEDCRLILANESTNHLLQEGRVLILLPPELEILP